MNKIFILTAFILFNGSLVFAQTRNYDIIFSGDKVGNLTVTKKIAGNLTTYKLESRSELKVLFSTKKNYVSMDVTYKDGKLISSYCKNDVDDKTDNYASISWDGTKYNITNEKGKLTFNAPVTYSVISLYFAEPKGMKMLFTERIGEAYALTDLGSGRYEFKIPNGDKNIYTYENGQMTGTERKTVIGTVYVKFVSQN